MMIYKHVLVLWIFFERIGQLLSGTVKPEVADSVLPYRNNENAIGKYVFTFKISSPILSQPRVTIEFPSIYTTVLKTADKCKGTVTLMLKNEKANMDCVISGRIIAFELYPTWTEIDAGNLIVEVFDVTNPTSVQEISSGNFDIKTWSGIDILIDSNVAFPSIAFASQYTGMTGVSMINDGANIAGYTTNYIISFTNAYEYKVGTWFRLEFPQGFAFQTTVS